MTISPKRRPKSPAISSPPARRRWPLEPLAALACLILGAGCAVQPGSGSLDLSARVTAEWRAYRGESGRRAMAISADGQVFGIARCAPGCGFSAPSRALARCEAKNARETSGSPPRCALFAIDDRVIWRGEIAYAELDALAPIAFAPASARRLGPEQARGVVLMLPGYDPRARQTPDLAPPPVLAALAASGWDVEMGAYPAGGLFEGADARLDAAIGEAIAARRAAGYPRIALAGHSFGAWTALRNSDDADLVIAAAPARHGPREIDGRPNPAYFKNASGLSGLLAKARTPIALAFFEDDPFDPGGRADVARELLERRGVSRLIIDRPKGERGHLGFWRPTFALRFGPCLAAFAAAEPAGGEFACIEPAAAIEIDPVGGERLHSAGARRSSSGPS